MTGEQPLRLRLVGRFRLDGSAGPIPVRRSGERLLAFVALRPDRTRESVAWSLWLDQTEERALASLRSTLWRLPKPGGRALVSTAGGVLRLAGGITVDVVESREWASGAHLVHPGEEALDDWSSDLLPGWYDDWLLVERERHRQLRLHVLEALADRLVTEGRTADGIEVGLRAVGCEPLRESAHRCVVRAHIAEGNLGEALRQAETYLRLLAEAGIPVSLSAQMETLLGPACAVARDRSRRPRAAAMAR